MIAPGKLNCGEILEYRAADGDVLRYRRIDAVPSERDIVYLHGIESHGGWFVPAAERLARRGTSCSLIDRRSSGLNSRQGHADAANATQLLADVQCARSAVAGRSESDVHLVGLSWGGKLALASALQNPVGISSLTLITPGLAARVDLCLAEKIRLLAALACRRTTTLPIPIEPEMFTTRQPYLNFIRNDPLRLHMATARFFWVSRALDRFVRRRISELSLPTLCLLAGGDEIIDNDSVRTLLGRASRPVAIDEFEGASHSLQFDHVDRLVDRIHEFQTSL